MSEKKETKQVERSEQFLMTQAGQDEVMFHTLQRKANALATSDIVPQAYRGKLGNCLIALEMAQRMGALPLMIMQNLYVVHGTPAFSSKFLIGCINSSKRFSPLRYEFRGEEGEPSYGCRAYAYETNDTERKDPLYGDWITLEMAQKEGWASKTGSKWLTMPNQMLRYRAAAFWQRVYCPEISMGLMTAEEAEDIAPYVTVSTQHKDDIDILRSTVAQAMSCESVEPVKEYVEPISEGSDPFGNE